MKLKIKHRIEKEVEVEIEIPSYYRVSCHYFKVYSETQVLAVCELSGFESIQKMDVSIIFNAGGEPVKITPEQFNDKLEAISNKLQSL